MHWITNTTGTNINPITGILNAANIPIASRQSCPIPAAPNAVKSYTVDKKAVPNINKNPYTNPAITAPLLPPLALPNIPATPPVKNVPMIDTSETTPNTQELTTIAKSYQQQMLQNRSLEKLEQNRIMQVRLVQESRLELVCQRFL